LVAAVAAAVLIQTSGVLQEKAQSTGKQAAEEVSSNLMIKGIEGIRSSDGTDSSSTVDLIKVKVALNIGSSPIDLDQAVITITDGSTTNDLVYANNEKTYGDAMEDFVATNDTAYNMVNLTSLAVADLGNNGKYFFILEKIRDEDGSFTQEAPIMNQGDLVNIYISTVSTAAVDNTNLDGETHAVLKDSGLTVSPRSTISLVITPESGSSTTAGFTTPTFGIPTSIALWP